MAKNLARPVTQPPSALVSNGTNGGYLASVELSLEGNYNMACDGIINNVPKPSLLERLEELELRKRERHKDKFSDDRRERHKADYIDSKDER